MSNSGLPEEPGVSVRKIDNAEENESPNLPQQAATNEVPEKSDPSSADEQVAEGAKSKSEVDNADRRHEYPKADEPDQNKADSPSPSDKYETQQPEQIENTIANDDSNAVRPGDASNSSKSAPDATKFGDTNEKDDDVSPKPSEVQTESKESDGSDASNKGMKESKKSQDMHLAEENEAIYNLSKKETQGENDATSKTEDAKTTDAMEIDTKPTSAESEERGEGAKGVENNESSKDKEEVAGSAVEEMDIDSERVDDGANVQKTEQIEEEQNGVLRESETANASETATKAAGSKDALSKQTVEYDEQGKSAEPVPRQERTGNGSDEEEESNDEEEDPTGKDEEMSIQTKVSTPKEEENTVTDSGENQTKSGRPRRSSARNAYEPRSLRPRTAGRVNNFGTASESPKEDMASDRARAVSDSAGAKLGSTPDPDEERLNDVDDENIPRPAMEANGLVMRIEEAVFVTKDQLDELKIARLTDKKVKPFEELTFQDLRTYNRDQLRAYCFAYGMARRKKTEMEADMARYLSYWNKGREGFALHDYVPTSSRVIERVEPNPSDNFGAVRGTTSAGSASQDGSATPSTSNGKVSGLATKPPSSRAATPSKGVGTAANSARVSASQGSSAPSGGGTGISASTGNAIQSGSSQAGTHRNTTTGGRTAKMGLSAPILPRGFGTSFKQKVHARQGGAKFKAAYNGAGPAIVNIVENAAAYFEGKDSPEVILDQAKSYERYQFNVDMLNEIFDGVPEDSEENDGDVVMNERDGENALPVAATKNGNLAKTNTDDSDIDVLDTVASRVASGKRKAQTLELAVLDKQFREAEERTKHTERTNMRLFQRLERAETKEQVEAVKREFEAVHHITFDESVPPPLVRRKLDKSLPPIVMSDDKCRILRFKVS